MSRLNQLKLGIKRESPTILTGFGVIGVPITVWMAIKDTISAIHELEENSKWPTEISILDLRLHYTNKEILKLVWPCYIPTAISATLTIAAIIGSNRISVSRQASMATLLTMSQDALFQYREKVVDVLGKRKEEKIRDDISQDKLDANPVTEVLLTGKGENPFYEPMSGRYFESDYESVRSVVNDFNDELFKDMFKTLNDFYDMLGLEGTELGRNIGWDVNEGKMTVHYATKLTPDNRPCVVLEHLIPPKSL